MEIKKITITEYGMQLNAGFPELRECRLFKRYNITGMLLHQILYFQFDNAEKNVLDWRGTRSVMVIHNAGSILKW